MFAAPSRMHCISPKLEARSQKPEARSNLASLHFPPDLRHSSVETQSIVVLDFGAQYSQLIARRIREQNVFSVVLPCTASLDEIRSYSPLGVILSGGPCSVYDQDAPNTDRRQRPDRARFSLGPAGCAKRRRRLAARPSPRRCFKCDGSDTSQPAPELAAGPADRQAKGGRPEDYPPIGGMPYGTAKLASRSVFPESKMGPP